jgi:MoaA/NifB/PqqE/SkfB family radical SAM enzyme
VILKQGVLRKFQVAVTFGCPMKCAQCSSDWLIQSKRSQLSVAQIAQAIDQALDLGAITVILTGGEPLLRKDLEDIVASVPKSRAMVSLNTSAYGLTPQRIASLKKAGLGSIAFSFDSSDSQVHDKNRGVAGLHERVLQSVPAAKAAGLYTQLTCVIKPGDLATGDVVKVADIAESLGVELNLIWSAAVGRWEGRTDLLFKEPEIEAVYETLLSRPHVRWQGSSNYAHDGCQAGREKLYLTAFGEIMPCDGIPVSFGNVLTTPLREIWEKMRRVDYFDEIQTDCQIATEGRFYDEVIAPLSSRMDLPVAVEEHPMAAQWGFVPAKGGAAK